MARGRSADEGPDQGLSIWSRGRASARRAGSVTAKDDFHSRLVDALLEADIVPFVTLFHWDLPQRLQDEGGWPRRSTAEAFVGYADAVGRALGDRVKNWITHNEPWCASLLSHQIGRHAPGLTDWPAALAASHHLLLSHGWSVPVLRSHAMTLSGHHLNPTPSQPERATGDIRHFDGYFNRWFLDPSTDAVSARLRFRRACRDWSDRGAGRSRGDRRATDFLGINYNRTVVSDLPEQELLELSSRPRSEWTEMGRRCRTAVPHLCGSTSWPRSPTSPERGSWSDGPGPDGRPGRAAAAPVQSISAARRAMASVPLDGYFVWSLMDNFEWERGYGQRFGVVWVDYETQRRIPKDSALWYRRVIESNSAETD
jgi:beta-glucosidase